MTSTSAPTSAAPPPPSTSADAVVLGNRERNHHPITFWQFTKYGLIVTAVTIALCALYLWLRYFALA
ncbi:hypothetical protein [Streptomyces sp. NBC_00513]|uniref:hypothetical protein n=1 Tax=Streptomyces sp. NBC_00513 TaxID=2975763 RepID=UPI00352CB402